MAGLVPAIHVVRHTQIDVDARDKPGHDEVTHWQAAVLRLPCFVTGRGRMPASDLSRKQSTKALKGCF
jgi:hypothetical protein